MTQIDPRALRIYLAVCREGSISAAARALNMAQPSVSVAMGQLERSLGAQMFERSRVGVRLTPAGEILKRRAEALETLLEVTRREIALSGVEVAGPLSIGGTPGALASIVPHIVARLERRYPRFELQVLERSDAVLMDLLRSERIDLAIVTTGLEAVPHDMAEETLLSDPLDLIVGRAQDRLPEALGLAALQDARWVLPDAVGAFQRQVSALFVAARMATPQNVIRCDSLLTTKAIVRQTDYVTILPRQVALAELSIGVLRAIHIEDVDILRHVGVRRLTDRPLAPIAEAFLHIARGGE